MESHLSCLAKLSFIAWKKCVFLSSWLQGWFYRPANGKHCRRCLGKLIFSARPGQRWIRYWLGSSWGSHSEPRGEGGCVSEMLLGWMLHKSHTNHHGITPFQILPGLLIPRVHKLSIKPAESTVKTTACFFHHLTGNGLTCRGVWGSTWN